MANTRQAKKRAHQSEQRRAHNASQRSELRTAIRKVVKATTQGTSDAAKIYQAAVPVIDSLARKGIIHKNKAARHKSRLARRVAGLAAAAT